MDGTEVVKANTIEELAALMGVDADTLVKSVETYNTACATGNDTEFGKGTSNLTAIDAAPYYAVRIYVCTGGTIAGVKTNLNFQVLREDGSVINGLYAGGETSNREMYAITPTLPARVGYAPGIRRQIGRPDEINTAASSKRRCPAFFAIQNRKCSPFYHTRQWCPQCWRPRRSLSPSRRAGAADAFPSAPPPATKSPAETAA